jgi:hypothetical protein
VEDSAVARIPILLGLGPVHIGVEAGEILGEAGFEAGIDGQERVDRAEPEPAQIVEPRLAPLVVDQADIDGLVEAMGDLDRLEECLVVR